MHHTAQYFGRHCSFGCFNDDVAVESVAKVLISVVESCLTLLVRQDGVCTGLHQVLHDQVMAVTSCDVKWSVHLLVCLLINVLALTDNDTD